MRKRYVVWAKREGGWRVVETTTEEKATLLAYFLEEEDGEVEETRVVPAPSPEAVLEE